MPAWRGPSAGALGALVCLGVFLPDPSEAAEIQVPRHEATIASAMRRAAPGDTIVVEPGVHLGPVDLKPNVRLIGRRGSSQTVLTRTTPGPALFAGGGGAASAIVGFTVRAAGVGIDVEAGALQLWDCRFEAGTTGLRLRNGARGRVFACEFDGLPVAIDAEAGSDLLMMRNRLTGNEVGARIGCRDARVLRNEFLDCGIALEVLPAGSAVIGGALREANGFLGSRRLSLHNRSPEPVNASLNYWGTVDCDSAAVAVAGPVVQLPLATAGRDDSVSACP